MLRKSIAIGLMFASAAFGSEISWSRFKGTVKAIDYKASTLTIQNSEGDLVGIKVNGDVTIRQGKDDVPLSKVQIDDKVTLFFAPKAAEVKGPDDTPDANGILPPLRR